MGTNMSTDDQEQRSLWTKFKGVVGIHEEFEDEYEEADEISEDSRKRPQTLRLHSARVSYVSVRLPQSIEDARVAADGLKDGRQQIINLEKTSQGVSERIIDFLGGVTYALNGFVEKVGDRVYLFAPNNVMIDVPEDLHDPSTTLFDSKG